MNKSPLTKVLLGVLAVLALWSLILCYTYINRARQLREMQATVNGINVRQQVLSMLVNDCVEYSKKNAAINHILQSIGVNPGAAPAAATAPAKPATK